MIAVNSRGSCSCKGSGNGRRLAMSRIPAGDSGICVRARGGGACDADRDGDTAIESVVSGVGPTITEKVVYGSVRRDGGGNTGNGGVCSGTPPLDTGVVAISVMGECEC